MTIRICVAGATGWTGRAITAEILASKDLELVSAIARRQAGTDVGTALGRDPVGVRIVGSLGEALNAPADVLIDYTAPDSVKDRVLSALDRGVRVVVGTSGLTSNDYEDIKRVADMKKLGVIASGNFSITASLAKHFALIAAKYAPSWEVVDYATDDKIDSPSGTARELAEELGRVTKNHIKIPIEKTIGPKEARGTSIGGAQIHSIRLPSFNLSFEAIFGLPDERLTIRHDSGSGAAPYIAGTLLAARKVMEVTGLIRGLDTLMFPASK